MEFVLNEFSLSRKKKIRRKFIIETRRTGIIVIDFQSRASEIRTSTREINNSFSIKKKKKSKNYDTQIPSNF